MNINDHSLLPVLVATSLVVVSSLGFCQVIEDHSGEPDDRYRWASFGASIAIEGEWAVVGDPSAGTPTAPTTGLLVVYRRTDHGWSEWQTIAPQSTRPNQHFAESVALHGGDLVIGASGVGIGLVGRVYTYRLLGDSWIEGQALQASDGGLGFEYGRTVALDGETLVVGSPSYPAVSGNHGGACYIYRRGPYGWELSDQIIAPDAALLPQWEGYGYSRALAVDHDLIVVGAPSGRQGIVFVYRRSGAGWNKEADVSLSQLNPDTTMQFGSSVDVSNGTIALGAPVGVNPWSPGPTSVWMYDYDPVLQQWQQSQGMRASDWSLASPRDLFGSSLSLRRDRLLVGAPYGAVNGPLEGSAYLFERINGVWVEVEQFAASDPNGAWTPNGAQLGRSVALDALNNRVLVGAPDVWIPTSQIWYPGKAYFYDLNQGAVVCGPFPNAVGNGTRLTVTGTRTALDANVALSVYNAPPDRMGIFLAGPGGTQTPFGTAGASLCVGQPFSRLSDVQQIGPGGSAMLQLDFTTGPAANLISPGSRLTFQFVHRATDFLFGTQTINASEAVEVLFE